MTCAGWSARRPRGPWRPAARRSRGWPCRRRCRRSRAWSGVPSRSRVPPKPYGESGASSSSALDPVRVVDQQLHRHAAAHRVGDDQRLGAGRANSSGASSSAATSSAKSRSPRVASTGAAVGRAVAAQVGGDDAQVRRQVAEQRPPEVGGRAVAVDQQHRRAVGRPGDEDVLGDSARLHAHLRCSMAPILAAVPAHAGCVGRPHRGSAPLRVPRGASHRPVPTRE